MWNERTQEKVHNVKTGGSALQCLLNQYWVFAYSTDARQFTSSMDARLLVMNESC